MNNINSTIKDILSTKGTTKIIPPEELKNKLNLDINIPLQKGDLQKIISNSIDTRRKKFFNQLFKGNDDISIISDFVISYLNTSMYTYKVAPVFTLIELEVEKFLLNAFYGSDTGTMLTTPGGSMANFYAIHCALMRDFNNFKQKGKTTNVKIYVSKQAHYSIRQACMFLGIGENSLVVYEDNLELLICKDIMDGNHPLMIVGTAGTTVMGEIENLEYLSNIAKKNNMWFHVDAVWGGSLVFSSYKHYLKGIEKANSISWNAHKMLRCSLQTSVLLLKDPKSNPFVEDSTYLYEDKGYDSKYDLGKNYPICGRKPDSFKIWLRFKMDSKIKENLDRSMELTKQFMEYISKQDDIELINPNSKTPIVCFKTNREIKEDVMINFQDGIYRLVIIHPKLTLNDLKNIFKT